MEMLLDLAMTFWQWTVLGALVIIGFVINSFDKKEEVRVEFKYPMMPKMSPVPIATKGKGFWNCLLYTSPSPRDLSTSRMPSSA